MVCLHWLIERIFPWRLITVRAIKSQLGFVWLSKLLWILRRKEAQYLQLAPARYSHFNFVQECRIWSLFSTGDLLSKARIYHQLWQILDTSEKVNVLSRRLDAFLNAVGVSVLMESRGFLRLLESAHFSKATISDTVESPTVEGYWLCIIICMIRHWGENSDLDFVTLQLDDLLFLSYSGLMYKCTEKVEFGPLAHLCLCWFWLG